MNENNITILFAEDEKTIREKYSNVLRKQFKEVYEASNGEEGYEIFKEKRPNLLIVDINMPNLNGIDFIKKVREIDKNCKVIILTAHTDVDYLLKSTELNLVKYLIKPIKRVELNNAIKTAIEQLNSYDIVEKKKLLLESNYYWDFSKNSLFNDLNEVELTKSEKLILNTLFSNPNKELTYDDLIFSVWNDFDSARKDTLKTMINNLRRKLPDNTIKTMYGIGYKFNK